MSAKVLIVDDEPNLLKLVGFALYGAGYQALTARTGEEALRIIEEESPDLIVLDIMMPQMDGLEVLQRLRDRPATAGLPVIILSARTQVPDRIEGLEAGADEYVTKPVSPKELVARVGALLERTRRVQEAATGRYGQVIGCLGVKGGVGTTTLAVNLALALSRREMQTAAQVAAVELRSGPGTMVYQLGAEPTHTLADLLAREPEEIDEESVRALLGTIPGNLHALPASAAGGRAAPLTVDHTRALVRTIARVMDFTLLDLAPSPAPANRAALRQADQILLVCEPEPASMGAAQTWLRLLEEWGIERSTVGIVLTHHADNPAALSRRAVEAELGHWTLGEIPAAPELFVRALKAGGTFLTHRPESAPAQAFMALAAELVPAG